MDVTARVNELMARQEPLLPELEPYVDRSPLGWLLPYVTEIGLDRSRCALVNDRYRRTAERVRQHFEAEEFPSYIFAHERPHRLLAFIRCLPGLAGCTKGLVGADFGRVLRDVWLDCENVRQNRRLWRDVWRHDAEGRQHCMTAEERAALAAQPDRFIVWRGVSYFSSASINGFSWTLDRDKAIWFARRHCSKRRRAWLAEGSVAKKDVLAHFLGRSEQEIVSLKVYPRVIIDVTDDHNQ